MRNPQGTMTPCGVLESESRIKNSHTLAVNNKGNMAKREYAKNWTTGINVKIATMDHTTECKNWRGITIPVSKTKIMAQIVHKRISAKIEAQLRN